ncbi:tetratricopeptide repeat protein [Desulfobacula sp.]
MCFGKSDRYTFHIGIEAPPPNICFGSPHPISIFTHQLSNSVMDLIKNDKLDEAEAVSKRLLNEYPDQIDGFERFGQVYEARGEKYIAADYYQKAADFAKVMPGFDKEGVEYNLSKARKMREEKK